MVTIAVLHEVAEEVFEANDGRRLAREFGATPNGNPLHGRWVLRSADGSFLDFDQYRHDLVERNGLAFNYGQGKSEV